MGSLLHTIGGSVSQHTSEASLVQQQRFPLRLPVMVLRQEHGQAAAYHWPGLSAHELGKPGSAVAVLKRLPVMGLRQEHGQSAAYH